MKTSDFDYSLPEVLVAQYPEARREEARLLCIDKKNQSFSHQKFTGLLDYLEEGDVLVLNNTKVIPSRLFAHKEKSDAKIEIFLLKKLSASSSRAKNPYEKDYPFHSRWEVLLRPGKRVKAGDKLFFKNGNGIDKTFFAENPQRDNKEDIKRLIDFYSEDLIPSKIQKWGNMPLPPYIKRDATEEDKERYQTIFAEKEGAVAAPTAGLHFSQAMLDRIKKKGVEVLSVTLHVGYDTFKPIQTDTVESHKMHFEKFEISEETAVRINLAKKNKRRVIACGTTVVRTLEASAAGSGEVVAGSSETNIFIYPSFPFKVIDGLITNFHLPKSSLLMLVCAFGGNHLILKSYEEAISKEYRFYSFGDAMFIS